MTTKSTFFILPTFLFLSLTACTPMKAVRGNLVEDDRLAAVTPGTSTQSDVVRALGSPTTTDPFDPNTWYYIGEKTEKKGILDPKVTDERIIRAVFDDQTGVLTSIAPLDTARVDIPITKGVTPTSGSEMTAVQQIMGNLGKFNNTNAPVDPTQMGRDIP